MSREVHNGPTDETQARGTPYSGDPSGGEGAKPAELDKLALDSWHRSRGARMVPFAGYETAAKIAYAAQASGSSIFETALALGVLPQEQLETILRPGGLPR